MPMSHFMANLANPVYSGVSRDSDGLKFILSAAHSEYVRKLGI